jgi:hypothetical protein
MFTFLGNRREDKGFWNQVFPEISLHLTSSWTVYGDDVLNSGDTRGLHCLSFLWWSLQFHSTGGGCTFPTARYCCDLI